MKRPGIPFNQVLLDLFTRTVAEERAKAITLGKEPHYIVMNQKTYDRITTSEYWDLYSWGFTLPIEIDNELELFDIEVRE